jgi:hypothetical protein
VYEEDKAYFTYNDLKAEIPFDAEMVVLPIPGRVIADTVAFTRCSGLARCDVGGYESLQKHQSLCSLCWMQQGS